MIDQEGFFKVWLGNKNPQNLAQVLGSLVTNKPGATGPTGATGATGPTGATGATGAAGTISDFVYPVFDGGPYATIAAAIAQAVADGATIGRPATVLISPKSNSSGWAEDINLVAGVNIQGVWARQDYGVLINGTISYTPGPGGAPVQKVNVDGLWVQAPAGRPCVEIIGANLGKVYLRDCLLSKVVTGDTTPVIVMNGNSLSTLFIYDCSGNVFPGGMAYQITTGKFAATRCDISGGSAARALEVGATGSASMTDVNLVAFGPDVVNVASGGSYRFVRCTIEQVQANGSGIVQQGSGPLTTGSCLSCTFLVPTSTPILGGYAVKGTGIWANGNNLFSDNQNIQVPGLTPAPLATAPINTPLLLGRRNRRHLCIVGRYDDEVTVHHFVEQFVVFV